MLKATHIRFSDCFAPPLMLSLDWYQEACTLVENEERSVEQKLREHLKCFRRKHTSEA
ncbi:hypothetical protein J40TS1_28490 [Paenibacillus montaniterrae]|uniref:Uncharacterized protein n=1 Tax=Paenibacillus montaniterrae TaxID=429341 RepID=A0A919YMJ5_9BACL|nr:hypothetical protein J40TS1_28490 [Paenibacillus montaniterrae]